MAFNTSSPGKSCARDLTEVNGSSLFRDFDPSAFSRSVKSRAATSTSRGASAWTPQFLPADPANRGGGSRGVEAAGPPAVLVPTTSDQLGNVPKMHLRRLLATAGAQGLDIVCQLADTDGGPVTNDLYRDLAKLGGLDAVQAAASLLGDDNCLAKVNATPTRAARGVKLSADDIGLGDQAAVDESIKRLAQLGGVDLVANMATATPEMRAIDKNLRDLSKAIGADLGLPPQTRGTPAGVPDDVRLTLQQAGLGALSDGASWAPGGKGSVDRVLATVGPAGAEIVRLLAEEKSAVSDANKNEALANIAALGGVEGLHAAAIATGDRGLFGDIFGGVANVGLGILQGGLTGGLPGALMGGAGAGVNLVGSLIGNRDIDTGDAVRESNVVLANLVAAAGPRGIPLVAELQKTTDDAKIGLAYQRLAYLAGDAAPSAVAAAAQLSGDRGLLDMLKTSAGKAGSWAAKTGTTLAKDAAKQALNGALDAFNSGATWQDSLQAGFVRAKSDSVAGKAGSAAVDFVGGGSRGVDRSRSARAPDSGPGKDLTDDQRSALQQLENHPEISPLLLKQAYVLATSSESELLPGTRSMIQGALIGKLGMAAGEPIVEALENRAYLGNDDDATGKVSRAIGGGRSTSRSLTGGMGTLTFG
ncbi:hypothetical protein KFL_000330240 [Klebsormidium nitens]|uniref:Uncharacterized protein n=1 Tax=Klebsormidium nitens TaxID=105231 RepID=A0A1Y1HUP9_KLENI|nr:hypothetical protein KFL_000330240 [Klebsormidium nitens]|eukprot:GAQ79578.1 hypothetical protein KFL_000330240 [Klebsormidium nitens]